MARPGFRHVTSLLRPLTSYRKAFVLLSRVNITSVHIICIQIICLRGGLPTMAWITHPISPLSPAWLLDSQTAVFFLALLESPICLTFLQRWIVSPKFFPSTHNVYTPSHEHWCYVMTLHRRCINVVFVLRFYGTVIPFGSCRAWSVYLTTRFPGQA